MIIALAGGVGGARLAHGLAQCLPPEELVVVVNTADDFVHLGLHVSPDPDTVMYTLGGLADEARGWGQKGETWNFMAGLAKLGGQSWFQLGDRDLATHVERSRRLAAGESISEVTDGFAKALGIAHAIVPMSDDPVRTHMRTDAGVLPFQDYFVRLRCEPKVEGVEFAGIECAAASAAFAAAMRSPALEGIVICPSNPFVSVAPILALSGVRDWLAARKVPAIAVSPIIGGNAVKGPAAKMMAELGMTPGATAIAAHYAGLIDGFVIDRADAHAFDGQAHPRLHATDALMRDVADRARLARECLGFLATLRTAA